MKTVANKVLTIDISAENHPILHKFNCILSRTSFTENGKTIEIDHNLRCIVKDFNGLVRFFKDSKQPKATIAMLEGIKDQTPELTEEMEHSILRYNPLSKYDLIVVKGTVPVETFLKHLTQGETFHHADSRFALKQPGINRSSRINIGKNFTFWTFKAIDSAKHIHEPVIRTVNGYIETFANGSQKEFFKQFYHHATNGSAFVSVQNTIDKISEFWHENND